MSRYRKSHYYNENWDRMAAEYEPDRDCRKNFETACARFGIAYDHGCFCTVFLGFPKKYQTWCQGAGGGDCRGIAGYAVLDHSVYFRRDGKVTALVGQPYGWEAHHKARAAVEKFCARYDLKLEVSGAWHNSSTTALIFTRGDLPMVKASESLLDLRAVSFHMAHKVKTCPYCGAAHFHEVHAADLQKITDVGRTSAPCGRGDYVLMAATCEPRWIADLTRYIERRV